MTFRPIWEIPVPCSTVNNFLGFLSGYCTSLEQAADEAGISLALAKEITVADMRARGKLSIVWDRVALDHALTKRLFT